MSNVLTVSVPNDSAILAVNERGTVSLIETNHFSLQRSVSVTIFIEASLH